MLPRLHDDRNHKCTFPEKVLEPLNLQLHEPIVRDVLPGSEVERNPSSTAHEAFGAAERLDDAKEAMAKIYYTNNGRILQSSEAERALSVVNAPK